MPAAVPALLRPELAPATIKDTRWGGHRLAARLSDEPTTRGAFAGRSIGELWQFSTLPGSESLALGGRGLGDVLGRPLPFLAKLIDTALPLSVQVHPEDRPDPARPGAILPGKEEAWIVLAADPDARLWAGVRPGVSRDDLARAAADGTIVACLEEHVVTPGLVVLVPAGTVHAIGAGILLAEIQQPSDCTYRLYDYDSGRPLHVEAALATLDVAARPQVWRPGDASPHLRGTHVELELLGPGEHRRALAEPTLIVGTRGTASVRADDCEAKLDETQLLLAVRGPLILTIPEAGLVAVGRVHA
ncbi:class I mannose-6-phosphate isomerase [Nannocystis bainbridge]|uniref:Class I mannose-6-phosphate isomerase n=1 Tax=Nannocystis bainbridge TaxID=2995303 RepID=A0ABT5DTL5_9BACT|nr:class I mannose-6-phosphate isomerase [Nannocystis bainbridge]MDC0716984.1 class I mannose-6-phosphate isomerase [Nannocystis bainbridge]